MIRFIKRHIGYYKRGKRQSEFHERLRRNMRRLAKSFRDAGIELSKSGILIGGNQKRAKFREPQITYDPSTWTGRPNTKPER